MIDELMVAHAAAMPRRSSRPLFTRSEGARRRSAELKEELEARCEAKSGNKAWLRRRLHAAIVRAHLAATAEDE